MIRRYKILPHQLGLMFRDDQFVRLLTTGTHWLVDPLYRCRVELVSTREVVFQHKQMEQLIDSEQLKGHAITLELSDYERGLVWINGRFAEILRPGAYALWTTQKKVRAEVVDARQVRFEHVDLPVISRHHNASTLMNVCDVDRDHAGVYHLNGRYIETLSAGRYAFWRDTGNTRVVEVDLRERMIDITGQDVMTADNLTLRLNTVIAFRVTDVRRAVSASQCIEQSMYREAQLALRDMIGARLLDDLLLNKQAIAAETQRELGDRVAQFGAEVVSFGIRDVILPGEMKELLNQVTQAKKAAEANLISRREETAAMRSQANTAKLLDANPTLMRLRELEVLEKVASSTNLKVVLGEEKLGQRLTRLV